MANKQLGIQLEFGAKTKICIICEEWTTEQLYRYLVDEIYRGHTLLPSDSDEFYLVANGIVLERSSSVTVRDHHLQHLQRIIYLPNLQNVSKDSKSEEFPTQSSKMDNESVSICVEVADRTKTIVVQQSWTIKQLYAFVAAMMTLARDEPNDNFNLVLAGSVLDQSKYVRDYHVASGQRIVYVQRVPGGSGLQPLSGHITLTSDPCCVTDVADPSEHRAKMPCGCAIAVESMELLCESTIRKGKHTFSCPGCNAPWEFFLVRHVLSAGMTAEELKTISRQLDENYLNNLQQDIRQCLMCKTYSMRDFRGQRVLNGNRVVCRVCTKKNGGETVEFCWLCGQQWRSGPNGSCGNANCGGPAESINTLATCGLKTIYGVDGVPDTRACPKCGLLINHVKKCKHMVCGSCGLNFCFVCLQTMGASGQWPCGSYSSSCPVAPRQTSIPKR